MIYVQGVYDMDTVVCRFEALWSCEHNLTFFLRDDMNNLRNKIICLFKTIRLSLQYR